ncbi:MAG: DegT/DnrJ/EryC1/StrS family aminotransferase [Candidatus Omnitrophica bacterium]|nr:DegT/DnrJ/EryC1/StrS family aminotransferase [Candidatus Omnitrophota bacterium]
MPGIPILDLTRQVRVLRPKLDSVLRRVLASGQFVLGPEVARFEQEFARFSRARFGIGVASGTDALELSLRALGIGPGHLVATVSFTFLATVDAILHVGARPLFVDIDPKTYTMDPSSLEGRIRRLSPSDRRRLKGVIPVHLFGHPCDMDSIGKIAKAHRLAVIEDAAQGVGAAWRGRPVGSFGDAGCFSFFPSKNLGAFGDGGMVVTNSPDRAKRLRLLRVHGRGVGDRQLLLGRNSRLDELQAAVLRVKLRALKEWTAKRRALARLYSQKLSGVNGLECPAVAPFAAHALTLYVVRVKRRAALQKALQGQGISTRVYYPTPVHREPLHRKMHRADSLPETDRAAREVLALPLFPELRRDELHRVCLAIRRFCSQ